MERKLSESQIVRELRDLVDDATPEARVAALCTGGTIIFAALTVVLGLVRGTPGSLAAPLVPLCAIAPFGGIFSYYARRAEVRLRQLFPPAWAEPGPYR